MTGALSEITSFPGFFPFPVLILSLHPHFSGNTSSINYLYMKPDFETYFWRCQLPKRRERTDLHQVFFFFFFLIFLFVCAGSLAVLRGDYCLVAALGLLSGLASRCGEGASVAATMGSAVASHKL